jgi:hypothetical protein
VLGSALLQIRIGTLSQYHRWLSKTTIPREPHQQTPESRCLRYEVIKAQLAGISCWVGDFELDPAFPFEMSLFSDACSSIFLQCPFQRQALSSPHLVMLSQILILVISATLVIAQGQTHTKFTPDLGQISETTLNAWCASERAVCSEVCGGDASPNACNTVSHSTDIR